MLKKPSFRWSVSKGTSYWTAEPGEPPTQNDEKETEISFDLPLIAAAPDLDEDGEPIPLGKKDDVLPTLELSVTPNEFGVRWEAVSIPDRSTTPSDRFGGSGAPRPRLRGPNLYQAAGPHERNAPSARGPGALLTCARVPTPPTPRGESASPRADPVADSRRGSAARQPSARHAHANEKYRCAHPRLLAKCTRSGGCGAGSALVRAQRVFPFSFDQPHEPLSLGRREMLHEREEIPRLQGQVGDEGG